MTDQGNLEKLSVNSGVTKTYKRYPVEKKKIKSCGKAAVKTRKISILVQL